MIIQKLRHKIGLHKRWWLRAHTPYQPLFVVATCRSGSNLLLSYLGKQPGVCMRSELLYPGTPFGVWRYKTPPEAAIRHLKYSFQAEKSPIRGCKLMLYQLANCQLTINDVRDAFPTAKFIVLYRQNLAEQFVSHKIADATRQYTLLPGQEAKRTSIVVDPKEILAYCDEVQAGYHDLLSNTWLRRQSVLLSYEELVDRPGYWIRHQICPMLGIEAVAPSTQHRKQNPGLSTTVANYAKVKRVLSDCRQWHEWPEVRSRQLQAA